MSGHCQRADFWLQKHIDRATPNTTLTQNVTRFVGEILWSIIIAFFVLFYTFPIFSERPKVLDYFPENGGAACGVIIFDGYTHVLLHGLSQCGIPLATTACFISSIKPQCYHFTFSLLYKNTKFWKNVSLPYLMLQENLNTPVKKYYAVR